MRRNWLLYAGCAGQQRRDRREEALSQRILEEPTDDTGAYNSFTSFMMSYFRMRTSLLRIRRTGVCRLHKTV